jgi:two-component system cell cycle response regulator
MNPSQPQLKRPRALTVLLAVALVGLLAHAAHASFGLGGSGANTFFKDYVYDGVMIAAASLCIARAALERRERIAWLMLGIGLASYAAGEVYYSLAFGGADAPVPSIADIFYLGFYPLTYIALMLLARAQLRQFRASLYLDGAIGALGIAAIGAAVVFEAVVHSTGGAHPMAVATTLAYPLGDLLLLAIVMGMLAITGWRPGRTWGLLAAGLVLNGLADSIYLYQTAKGTYVDGTLLDSTWLASTLLLAYAAWMQPRSVEPARLDGWRPLAIPTLFALTAVGVLTYGNAHPVNDLALGFAVATLVTVIVRMALTFGENRRMLARSRHEALTDSLTGLGNRRALLRDLDRVLAEGDWQRPRLLAIFDLNGFKHYNDSFGHPAGDSLLTRLGHKLAAEVEGHGTAYRLGGDEFCVLADIENRDPKALAGAAGAALLEHGKGFVIGACYGDVVIPTEATDSSEAMRLADQRLYAQKASGRASASAQARDVLLSVLRERAPDLADHLSSVAELAATVAAGLGLRDEALNETIRAAELHDVGKTAIPDAILNKPGPLDDSEWEFIRRHTLIGERILAAAPALRFTAEIVRSSHERFDGTGYPDRLARENIPLAARIIAVCDAYDAMTSGRPYRPAMTPAAALTELRQCAGAQFDPIVVERFCHEVEHRERSPRHATGADVPTAA